MKKLLEANIALVALTVILFSYLVSFISTDVVVSDKIYQKYLDEKYDTKYNEYKELDIDLSEFEEELKQFETPAENSSYGWDTFYIDSLFILVPLLLVVLGFSSVFLVLILFHKKLHAIKYVHILKISLLSYLIFEIPRITSAIYFLVFKKEYELKDIHNFESYFSLDKIFDKKQVSPWFWEIVSETGFVYFLFPLLVALFLHYNYKNFKTSLIIGYSFLAYFIVFVLYNTLFWYLFDLI
tara:strand:- start:5223 stop:5942 length:720 start_codon:yes stop_codon:yes gene_type:complete